MKLRKWWDTAISVTLSGCLRKNMEQPRIAIKKIKTGKPNEEDLADLSLIFRYHKDVNINSVFTEISSMENVLDLEEG